MPQRRNYYGGGYYDQSSENYDPYSKWGNVGLTIRNTIAKIVAKRKEEQELAKKEAQEKWAMGLEERKMAAEEARTAAQVKAIEQKQDVPALYQEALLAAGGDPVKAGEYMRLKLNPPKETLGDFEAKEKIKAKYQKPTEPKDELAPIVDQYQKNITRIAGELNTLRRATIPNDESIQSKTEELRISAENLSKIQRIYAGYKINKNTLNQQVQAELMGILEPSTTVGPPPPTVKETIIVNLKTGERKALRNGQWVTIK